jgi:hypothetical protein
MRVDYHALNEVIIKNMYLVGFMIYLINSLGSCVFSKIDL